MEASESAPPRSEEAQRRTTRKPGLLSNCRENWNVWTGCVGECVRRLPRRQAKRASFVLTFVFLGFITINALEAGNVLLSAVCVTLTCLLACFQQIEQARSNAAAEAEARRAAEAGMKALSLEEQYDVEEGVLVAGSCCAVCLEAVEEDTKGSKLRCGHVFHRECIEGWLGQPKCDRCPCCRASALRSVEPAGLAQHEHEEVV
jgi:hypothetical protein